MPNETVEFATWPTDRMSISKEFSSKRLLQYFPGFYRIPTAQLMRKAYEHNRIATDKNIDNSTAIGLHQELQLRPHQAQHLKLQNDSQHGTQHRQHHCLHQCRHLIYDIIYTALG